MILIRFTGTEKQKKVKTPIFSRALRVLSLAAFVALAGCSQMLTQSDSGSASLPETYTPSNEKVLVQLQQHFQDWKGTPYQLGGDSKAGIDCSAFVGTAYASVYNAELPRTTEAIADFGHEVERSAMKPGDLVLFKTGVFDRHVGIYMGKGVFMHASTSKGVIKSTLSNPYWRKAYWKSVRPEPVVNYRAAL